MKYLRLMGSCGEPFETRGSRALSYSRETQPRTSFGARHRTNRRGWAGKVRPEDCGRPNGSGAKLRGQGPRRYGRAARRLPAFEGCDAGGVTPRKLR